MPQEDPAHQRHHEELFQQLVAEVVHRPINQLAAVVGGNDLYTRGQAGFQLIELLLDRCNGLASVFAAAQNHHAAHGLALTVEF